MAVVLSAGCAGAVDPAVTGGRPLPGTGDASCRAGALQLSPADGWLLYESRTGDPFHPVFVFYDLVAERGHATTLSPAAAELAAEGRGPTLPALWPDEDGTVVFPGHGVGFEARPAAGRFELVPVPPSGPPPAPPQPGAAVAVEHLGPRRLRLVDAAGTVLAEHRAEDPTVDRLEAGPLRPSPDGAAVAYLLHRYRGSFTAPPAAWVLPVSPSPEPPILLAAPAYEPLLWSRRGELFACAGAPDGGAAEHHVVRWTPDPGPRRES